ncbi:MAG: DUF948 domain-containing protein [Nitrospinaceae bacterium]
MTTSDKENENESTGSSEDRLEEIKKEEQEDASAYYAQGHEESTKSEEEFNKTAPEVDKDKEEMSLLKAVAFLGFGLAALAIIFILFFIRDLDHRVGGVDSAVNKLQETIPPLKTEFEENLKKVNEDLAKMNETVSGLQGKMGDYERMMAVMELKRALVTVQEMSMGSTAGVKSKSDQVVASIQSLLSSLSSGKTGSGLPAGIVKVEEAPQAAEPAQTSEQQPAAEEAPPTAEPAEPAETTGAAEEAPASEEESVSGEQAGESGGQEAVDEAADESEEQEAVSEESAEESEGDSEATEEAVEKDDGTTGGEDQSQAELEELPTVEEMLEEGQEK